MKYFIFLFFPLSLICQEKLSELNHNPSLLNYKHSKISSYKNNLLLPFADDFSYDSFFVDSNLWYQSSIYVNRTYPFNPPTIGVATFDGLDKKGFPRNLNAINISNPSDTLTSNIIDISNSSNVFFMFYFQSKGIGDTPELSDSLILELLNDNLDWERVWFSISDSSMTNFKKVVNIINEPRFLHSNFQFRFRNYATVNGNFDHWHIDYIKLDDLNSLSDTTVLDDVSFVYNSSSLLKRYDKMPWNHFVGYESNELVDSIDVVIRNNQASTNVDYQYNIYENDILIETFPNSALNWRNYDIYDYDSIGNFSHDPIVTLDPNSFSSVQTDSAIFTIKHIIQTSNSDNKYNDTLNYYQDFYSYFSYDDGTAESAYGINANNAKIAYEFKLNRPDTLRAIQMYFPQFLDSVSNIPFMLTVWSDIIASENIIYQQEVLPVHSATGNFHTYYLDSLFQIVGTFYIGWQQLSNNLLNIGLDKNNEANNFMFYNTGSGWLNSLFKGSWMIRPIVSSKKIISVLKSPKIFSAIYPNPVSETIYISNNNKNNLIYIYDIQGLLLRNINSSELTTSIDVSDLTPALYIIEVINDFEHNKYKFIKK